MIYFVQAGTNGPIKIGKAVNVARRVSVLQTGSFEALTVLAVAPGEDPHERALHRKFATSRIRLEWFRPSDELVAVVQFVRQEGRLPPLSLAPISREPRRDSKLVLDTEALRTRLGNLSQSDFAQLALVDQSSVSLWETNKTVPRRAVAAWIIQHCAAKNISPEWKASPAKRVRAA